MASRASDNRPSRRAFGALCVLALVVSLAAVFAGSGSATTAPGSVYTVQAIITDKGVKLVPHKRTGKVIQTYIRNGGRTAEFPRGVMMHFVFTNKGTKTYLPAIRVLDKTNADPYTQTKSLYKASKAIKPGGHVSLFGNFYFRGSFQIEKLLKGKPQGGTVKLSIY